MPVVDWRSWAAQQGGMLPTAPNPPGDPRVASTLFPGILPLTDKILGANSFPTYSDTPISIPARDPFVVTTGPPQVSWTAQMERAPSMIIRPPVTGLTS